MFVIDCYEVISSRNKSTDRNPIELIRHRVKSLNMAKTMAMKIEEYCKNHEITYIKTETNIELFNRDDELKVKLACL